MLAETLRERVETLTPRERDVYALMREGMQTKAIAQRLSINRDNVKHYRRRVRKKLGGLAPAKP